jgi:hypothetical protein
MARYQSRAPSSPSRKFSLIAIIQYAIVSGLSFYFGVMLSFSNTHNTDIQMQSDLQEQAKAHHEMKKGFDSNLEIERQKVKDLSAKIEEMIKNAGIAEQKDTDSSSASGQSLFDQSLKSLAVGISKIEREDYLGNFDYGTPSDGNTPVLLIHHNDRALPSSPLMAKQLATSIVPMSAADATKNCDFMHVVTVPNKNDRMCTAVVQNFENWHVQKWMRQGATGGGLVPTEPLRVVNRGMNNKGGRAFKVPSEDNIRKHWKTLETFFSNFDVVVAKLKPIAEKVAIKNTVIVMTCNMGQSELLMNFVCNAKAKGLDVSNVLVFPTDQETKDLAEGLGLATFHDEMNFGALPKGEAKHYGDRAFVAMMFAKVVCVQMINFLGYDLLFQDVDVVWYKNPLEYFHDPTNEFHGFDMYFQDDGAHTVRYAPYSANSGFYYIRNNPETKYFLTSLLYAGDLILTSNSHQQALIQVMTEHASQFGMKVKVLSRDMDEFPGGWHYNRHKKDFMKSVAKGEIVPYIFHMSWTTNKVNKVKYFKQMGEWYTGDQCVQHTQDEILGDGVHESGELINSCCLAKPNIVCFYRDKPSKIPCTDSPPIDNGKPSFW